MARLVDFVVRHLGEEFLERDAGLESRDCSAEADVRTSTERQHSGTRTENIELVRPGEFAWVAVGRPEQQRDLRPLRDHVVSRTVTSRVVVRVMYCVGLV